MDSRAQAPQVTGRQAWLAGEIGSSVAAAFEAMEGERPRVEVSALRAEIGTPALVWRGGFSGLPGNVWLVCSDPDWLIAGAGLMRAAGVEESDPEKLKPEFLEILRQGLSGAASAISQRIGRDISCAEGQEVDGAAENAIWSGIALKSKSWSILLGCAIDPALLEALAAAEPNSEPAAPKSKTYELLLDVELPVSVSFGRAQVPLKDVLKLTTGSVIDLNRDVADPVEVIVNNCVIARGEVVVVGGNFGVRIQQVISRQDRLRTLT
jgi:flagellar motor switch protein FliN/FliY